MKKLFQLFCLTSSDYRKGSTRAELDLIRMQPERRMDTEEQIPNTEDIDDRCC